MITYLPLNDDYTIYVPIKSMFGDGGDVENYQTPFSFSRAVVHGFYRSLRIPNPLYAPGDQAGTLEHDSLSS